MGNARNIAFWVVLFLLILALFNLFSGPGSTLQSREISYSEFVSAVESGQVSNVTLDGEQVRFRQSDGADYVAIKPQDAEITELLIENDVALRAEQQQQSGFPAIHEALRGQTYITPMIAGELLESYRNGDSGEGDAMHQLTPRQREVLQLIAEGKSAKQIASLLKISVRTAEAHKANILESLGLESTAELVQYAIRNGIISV